MDTHVPHEAEIGIPLTEEAFRVRMITSIAQAFDKAQGAVYEPLPREHRLLVHLFRQCGRGREMTVDEAVHHLYVAGTFARNINVSVFGIVDGQTLIGLQPFGRRYVSRVNDDGYLAGVAPFFPRSLIPIANQGRDAVTSLARLKETGTYLLQVALRDQADA